MSKIKLPVEDAPILKDLANNALSRYDRYGDLNDRLQGLYDRLFAAERRAKRQPTKARLWRRVARLIGDLAFGHGNDIEIAVSKTHWTQVEFAHLILRSARDPMFATRHSLRLARKLEAALKAWEECKE